MSEVASSDPAVEIGQIIAADPSFDLEMFKRNASQTFLAVKAGIQARDLTDVADSLSPRVYDDLREDVSSLVSRAAVRHFDGLTPTGIVVLAANHDADGDAITLRITALASQYLASEDQDDGASSGQPFPFAEVWTFSRPPRASGAAQRPECPTCGAPIDIDTGRICRYCKTLLPAIRPQGWLVAAIATLSAV